MESGSFRLLHPSLVVASLTALLGGCASADPTSEALAPDEEHVAPPPFRRFTAGKNSIHIGKRSEYICMLSQFAGNWGSSQLDLSIVPTIDTDHDEWMLRNVPGAAAICYRHDAFYGAGEGMRMYWSDDDGWATTSTGWPECDDNHSVEMWNGDAITYLRGARGEFEGWSDNVHVKQGTYIGQRSRGHIALDNCNNTSMSGMFGSYLPGIPGVSVPYFIGAKDKRLRAGQPQSEFEAVANAHQTTIVEMAPYVEAACYLTDIAGDFNGDGERVRIFAKYGRWQLEASAGGGLARGKARCLAFDQSQESMPQPH